ncbi:hypothetical protein [Lysobacter sp. D1-1-M9]|uniref:hypothetical protein n=1 Tax=Novilysobacter longmucuonensis TaxID=3098603 RepID=UPI002FCB7CA7
MQRLFSMFPRGGPGAGLLLLRVSVAASIYFPGAGEPHWAVSALLLVVATGFLAGIATPVLCLASIALMLALFWMDVRLSGLASAALSLQSIALLLLGPGAYSVDARLYGRRIVEVERRR